MPEPARSKWRRLWRRRLRRRPLLPFVLAAFVALDLAIFSLQEKSVDEGVRIVGYVLLSAQTSLLAIWVTQSWRGWAPRLSLAVVLVWLAVLGYERPEETDDVLAVAYAVFGMELVGSIAARAVASALLRRGSIRRPPRFRIDSLLWATFATVVVITALRTANKETLWLDGVLGICLFEAIPAPIVVFLYSLNLGALVRRLGLVALLTALVGIVYYAAMALLFRSVAISGPGDLLPLFALQVLLVFGALFALSPTTPPGSPNESDGASGVPDTSAPVGIDLSV